MPRGGLARRGGGVKRPSRPPKNTASKRAKTEAPITSTTSAYTRYVEQGKKPVDDGDEEHVPLTKSVDGITPDTVNSKGAPSYSSTGNPCLNLFYSAFVRGTPTERVHELMSLAWQHEPETALKILLHARDCRAGKGEKKVSLDAMLWLRQHKPATYLLMLESYLDVAYLKDLLMLTLAAQQQKQASLSSTAPSDPISPTCEPIEMEIFAEFLKRDQQALTEYMTRWGHKVDKKREQDVARIQLKKHKKGGEHKKEQDITSTPTQEGKTNDTDMNTGPSVDEPVIISVANGEATAMEDVDVKAEGEDAKKPEDDRIHIPHLSLSLAGKWTPTEGSSFDKQAKLAKRMARLLFPSSPRCFQEYRMMCSKLRQHLNIVERHMCLQQWDRIQFGHVPSKAHNLLKRAFAKHEQERYTAYIQRVKTGHAKINVGTVHPHEISLPYITGTSTLNETTEVQWKAMMDDLRKAQSESKDAGVGEDVFGRALAIVDVSGSMTGLPMQVAVSLGLIVQELTNPPFRGRLITFDKNPTWHHVKGDTLYDRVRDVMAMPWGMTTDLLKVFRMILGTAKEFSIPASSMPDTLFIFSDMQFDAAAGSDFLGTTHQHIQVMYREAGYTMPRIVFWNLNGVYSDVPVKELTPGVAAISGFSAQLLKLFMSCKNMTPYHIMLQAVDKYVVKIHEAER